MYERPLPCFTARVNIVVILHNLHEVCFYHMPVSWFSDSDLRFRERAAPVYEPPLPYFTSRVNAVAKLDNLRGL